MKKIIDILLKTIFMFCSLVLFSCDSGLQELKDKISRLEEQNKQLEEQINPKEEKSANSYTVMIYGAGGGNLDEILLNTLSQTEYYQFINGLDFNKVNITAQFNMSDVTSAPIKDESGNIIGYEPTEYQKEGSEYKGTMRWYMTKKGWNKSDNFNEVQMLHNPDVLTDFINYSKQKFPAEKYILILQDHGYCFDIREQPLDSVVTKTNARPVIFDTNNGNKNRPLTIFAIEEGIKNSDVKMELIYFNCCLMGQVEMLYQIRNQTNYVVSSSNPGWGSINYGNFFSCLSKNSNIVDAMEEYIDKAVEYWANTIKSINLTASSGIDMVLTDMSKIEDFADKFTKVRESFIKVFFSKPLTEDEKKENAKIYKPSFKQIEASKVFDGTPMIDDPKWKEGRLYYFDFFSYKLGDIKIPGLSYTDVDIKSAFSSLCADVNSEDTYLIIDVNNMIDALYELIVYAYCEFEPDFITKPSLGLTFIDKQRAEYNYYADKKGLGTEKYPTIKSCYQELAWDKKTGWSEFFEKNIAPE